MEETGLRAAATLHHSACDLGDLHPEDLRWRLVIDLPIEILVSVMEDGRDGWREWLEAEIIMHEADDTGYADIYRRLLAEPLENPVVISLEPGRTQIWDGWRRTATRVVTGATAIPAIVGTMPEGRTLRELVSGRLTVSGPA